MSPFETFFAFGISTFAYILLAIWCRYVPALIALYRVLIYQWNQQGNEKYTGDDLKFFEAFDGQAKT